jgi:hypothetical protein
MDKTIQAWLEEALADARRRGLPELEPLLRSLARSTEQLRAAAWNDSVAGRLREGPRRGHDDGNAGFRGEQAR